LPSRKFIGGTKLFENEFIISVLKGYGYIVPLRAKFESK